MTLIEDRDVHQPDASLRGKGVYDGHEDNDGNGNPSLLPFSRGAARSNHDIRGEDDASRR